MDLFDKALHITDNPEKLVRIFLPNLRQFDYFAGKIITDESIFDVESIIDLMQLISASRLMRLSNEIQALNNLIISNNSTDNNKSISDVIKFYLFSTNRISPLSHYIDKAVSYILDFIGKKREDETESYGNHIVRIREILKEIFEYQNKNKYSEFIADFTFIGYYAFSTCLLVELANKLDSKLNICDIIRFSIVYLCSRMEYEQRELVNDQWLSMVVNLLTSNNGRFFRVCKVNFDNNIVPLYKVISDSINFRESTSREWQASLFKNEAVSKKGLNRLFIFYVADIFVEHINRRQDSFINLIQDLKPYPNAITLKKYINLFLQSDLYSLDIDISSWEPPYLIKDYLFSNEMSYSEKEQALREEYFPIEINDLTELLKYSTIFYDEKVQLDTEYGNISNLESLDDISIWYLSEWLITERQYDFLGCYDTPLLAEMIADEILFRQIKFKRYYI